MGRRLIGPGILVLLGILLGSILGSCINTAYVQCRDHAHLCTD
jgi:hypothetical protein